ncbi:MAG: NAD(P)H-dependent glycerol-3-phosphate dehydrogenase [Acidimicrobiales bacterium]
MQAIQVVVIGAGSWGTTVASLTARNAPTILWARSALAADEINASHTNERYLPAAKLPTSLRATSDLEEAVTGADVVVMGVPSHGFRETLTKAAPYVRPWVPVVSLTKGLEQGSMLRMTEVIDEILPGRPTGVLTGPNLAREIMAGQAAATVLGMSDEVVARALQKVFRTGLFRVYTNTDEVGCEIAGALKNIVAIGAGMAEGLGVGDNTRSAVMTRGLAELSRLGCAMGGRAETFFGLAGMGDLLATCMSSQSRNRHVGEMLGRGESLDDIIDSMQMVAEGVKTSEVVLELAARYDVSLPIFESIYSVVHGGAHPADAYRGLVRRPAGAESEAD